MVVVVVVVVFVVVVLFVCCCCDNDVQRCNLRFCSSLIRPRTNSSPHTREGTEEPEIHYDILQPCCAKGQVMSADNSDCGNRFLVHILWSQNSFTDKERAETGVRPITHDQEIQKKKGRY